MSSPKATAAAAAAAAKRERSTTADGVGSGDDHDVDTCLPCPADVDFVRGVAQEVDAWLRGRSGGWGRLSQKVSGEMKVQQEVQACLATLEEEDVPSSGSKALHFCDGSPQ